MFKSRFLSTLLVVTLVFALYPTFNPARPAEAGTMWSAWFWNPETRALMRVFLDDSTYETVLDFPEGVFPQGDMSGVNTSGDLLAFCMTDTTAGTTGLHVQGISEDAGTIAEANQMALPFDYELGGTAICVNGEVVFSANDDTRLAVPVLNRFPGQPDADMSLPMWEILVFDLKSGAVAHRLTANDEAVAQAGITLDEQMPWAPTVRAFDDALHFSMMPYGVGGGTPMPVGYTWDIGAGTVTPNALYDTATLDTNTPVNAETGEIAGGREMVWPALDTSLPQDEEVFPLTPFNTLMYDDGTGQQYPIHQITDGFGALLVPTFVADGRYIAFIMYNVADNWRAIGRNGTVINLPMGEYAGQVMAAPGGYVFPDHDPETYTMTLRYHRIAEDGTIEESVLWESDAPGGWVPMWSAPVPGAVGLAPFAAG